MVSTASLFLKRSLIPLLFTIMLLSIPATLLAEVVGKLTRVEGGVDVMPGGQLPAVAARAGAAVQKGDFVRTKSNSRAEITFNDGSVIKIAQRSRIDVGEYSASDRKFALPRGKVQAIVVPAPAGGSRRTFEIRTPNAIAGVRGTSFYVYHQGNVTGVAVIQGVVHTASVANPSQGVTLVAGTGTTVASGRAPTPPRPLSESELNSHKNDVAPAAAPGASGNGEGTSGDGSGSAGAAPAAATETASAASSAPSEGTASETGSALSTNDSSAPGTPAASEPDPGLPAAPLDAPLPDRTVPTSSPQPLQNPVIPPDDATGNDIGKEPESSPLFSSLLAGPLMSRDATIDPASGLLAIKSDPALVGTLSGTTSLWGTGGAPATLNGSYPTLPLQQPNHYWFGELHSGSTTKDTTADGGAYYGYFGGASRDGSETFAATLSAIYVDPAGKTGILQGSLGGSTAGGTLQGSGSLTPTEMAPIGATDPASLQAGWWNSKTGSTVVEVTGPTLGGRSSTATLSGSTLTTDGTTPVSPYSGRQYGNESEGYLIDAGLNLTSSMGNRGDVLRLGYLGSDPSFGIWSRESFGSFSGSEQRFALISNAEWGEVNPDYTFTTEQMIKVISLGDWQSGGALSGKADGVWGELATGRIRLLTGTLTGSSNLGSSTFGAVTTGSFVTPEWFLANPTAAANLGFPTLIRPYSFTLSGTSPMGSVTVNDVKFYSRNSSDPISLWIAKINGSYSGTLEQQSFSLMNGTSAGSSSILGGMRITSTATGTNTWLGTLEGVGETGSSSSPFRSDFEGVLAGSFTGTSFTGTVAGMTHPVTYYSPIAGSLTRYLAGSTVSYGSIDGLLAGMSLWGNSYGSDFQSLGVFTPNQTITDTDFVMSASLTSKDVPTGSAMTADGGAYQGHLVAAVSTGGGGFGTPGVSGIVNALSVDPAGNAGILHGRVEGFVDPMNGVWRGEGTVSSVTLATAAAGVTAANLNSGAITTVSTPFGGSGSYFGGSLSPFGWAPDAYTRSFITATPDWGIGQFGLYSAYSVAPTSAPWNLDFNISDGSPASTTLLGAMDGHRWDATSGTLEAEVRASWRDLVAAQPSATPATGIFIGETVGTFNPASLQAMTSGVWMETGKFIALASTAAGQATLAKLNIPAVEVGKADFAGSNGDLDVTIRDLRFFAPVSGGRPQLFATDNVSGSYSVPNPAGSVALSQVGAGVATSGIAPIFSVNQWDTANGKWSATLSYSGASGVVGGNTNIQMMGTAAGRMSGGSAGSFTGTTAGVVR